LEIVQDGDIVTMDTMEG